MTAPILTQLGGRFPLAACEHLAMLYRGREAAMRWSSFLAEGLERRDLCLYLAPHSFHEPMLERIRAQGADPETHLRSGTLRLREGLKDPRELQQQAQQVFTDAEDLRVPAVRWLEEGSWPEAIGFPMEQFFALHTLLNYQVKHYPSIALCQYDLEATEPHHLFSAIAVHRHLIVEETLVRDNPFYIPAEKFIPLSPRDRERDLVELFRQVGFDVEKLLAALAGFGRLRPEASNRA